MSTVLLDVDKQESIDDAEKQIETITDGKLDILVNNAFVPFLGLLGPSFPP